MVQLSVSTSVSVKDGPTMTTGTDLPADSYVVATVETNSETADVVVTVLAVLDTP